MHHTHEQEMMNGWGQGSAVLGGLIGSAFGPGGTVVGAKVGYVAGLALAACCIANHLNEMRHMSESAHGVTI